MRSQTNARASRLRRMLDWGVEEELLSPAVLQALEAIKGLRECRPEAKEGEKLEVIV